MENGTPYSTMLSKLYYATELTGEKTQVAWVQEIPEFDPAPEGIEFSALDTDYTGQVPGRRSADAIAIPILFTEAQHDKLKALDKTKDYYWFILLPEETATTPQKPVCFNFQAKVRLGMAALAVDEMLQETITLYKSTEVSETKGLPTSAG
ncbi:MAG TPA: hypothetical protein IAB70_02090 [Candidatus Merdicola faecigallinarum]|jgi:hypothetical protein|uniref:Uncharacterized protein n=1 Tax=Candidatus Merdicola faecigallinarum TaxID=2840862 RepID=A0A9D1M0I3_9FIRM|nr:hypothetical protein [Candidatus Merdicola faecigallinarum]